MFVLTWILGILAIPIVFWGLFLCEICWLMWATEEESLSSAFWAILCGGSLGIIEFGSFGALFAFIKANPLLLVALFAVYLLVGTFWAFFKWVLFVRDRAAYINSQIESRGKKEAADHLRCSWEHNYKVEQVLESNFACLAPTATGCKGKITTWIILWVPSVIWFILNDPIRRAANWIFDNIKGAFQGVSTKIFKSAFKVD